VNARIDVAEHAIGGEDGRRMRRQSERERDPDRISATAAAHEDDADEHTDERGDASRVEAIAPEQRRSADHNRQVR
jgi:hypothetical protein